jgi:N-carbamoyl-L-amino-acid hydrolase
VSEQGIPTFAQLWETLEPLGRTTSGYRRYSWTPADGECRQWFIDQARARALDVVVDRNGNIWAWWGKPGPGAIVTGSHLDSVPDGGAFDGPLGVVSGLAAIDLLRDRGATPVRPVAVAVFVEEEGARFGLACLGSKLLTGAVDPDHARALTDNEGVTYADAMTAVALDPAGIGPDEALLANIAAFVELHIEQGRALAARNPNPSVPLAPTAPLERAVGANEPGAAAGEAGATAGADAWGGAIGLGESIWPHGRWRFDFIGRADHAGTARFEDRRDPMLPFASTVLAARQAAAERGSLATFGKVIVEPGGVNGVPSAVHAWLDARAADEETLRETVNQCRYDSKGFSIEHDVELTVKQESATTEVLFDAGLRQRIAGVLGAVPVLPTGAGHDAGVLAGRVPTAMLFVRNPTGVSHSPAEAADMADCAAGVRALATVLEELACK